MNKQGKISILFCLALGLLMSFNFQLNAQIWEELNAPPFYKHHSNGFGLNGKAYVFEGVNQENQSNEVWEYTPDTDAWVRLPDFPGDGRGVAIGDDWDGKYYYGFGIGGNYKNDLWVFDPVDTSYTQLPSCPCPGRTHPALIAFNDKIHMGSGSSGNGDLDDWWEYDMITQVWTQKTDMPGGPRHHPFFFAAGNSVFVGGGHVFNWLKYDLDTEEWSFIDDSPDGRVAGSQFSYDGYGFLLGGDDAGHTHVPNWQTFMRYNPQTDEWVALPELPNGSRWANSSFLLEDDLYFFGGLSDIISGDNSMWKFDLNLLDCLPLQNMTFSGLTDTTANLFWNSNPNAESDTLKWREVGATDWIDIPNPQATLVLEDLGSCSEYEVVFVTACGSNTTYSEVFTFRTKGCCTNPQFNISSIDENTTGIQWSEIPFADVYNLRWRAVGLTNWTTGTSFNATFEIFNLPECREYEFQIKSVCFIEEIEFSESAFFYSPGCGSCLDMDFCSAPQTLQGTDEYINQVRIKGYTNTTGSDNGYGNYAVPDLDVLNQGETFELAIEPVYATTPLDVNVWVDFNADGSFDANEKVVEEQGVQNEITKEITVPDEAAIGISRMRIIYGLAITGDLSPCDDVNDYIGEAEDYCLNIAATTNTLNPSGESNLVAAAFPNPYKNTIRLEGNFVSNKDYDLKLVNLVGQTVFSFEAFDLSKELTLDKIPSGVYFLNIEQGGQIQEVIRLVKE